VVKGQVFIYNAEFLMPRRPNKRSKEATKCLSAEGMTSIRKLLSGRWIVERCVSLTRAG